LPIIRSLKTPLSDDSKRFPHHLTIGRQFYAIVSRHYQCGTNPQQMRTSGLASLLCFYPQGPPAIIDFHRNDSVTGQRVPDFFTGYCQADGCSFQPRCFTVWRQLCNAGIKGIGQGAEAKLVKATGISGDRGEVHKADIVISAADGHTTLYTMLEGKYLTPKITQAYEHLQVFPSLVYICLGIKRDLRSHPVMTVFTLNKPIRLENNRHVLDTLNLRLYHFDPKAAIVMIPPFNTPWWTDLRTRSLAEYNAEKKRIADEVIAAIDEYLGTIRPHVEVVDVSTPATIIRYTNNWKGSFEGFLPIIRSMSSRLIDRTIPSLGNFYMVGQWVNPGGGLPPCGMDGLAIAQRICKEDGKKFVVK
jgi:hypothetical protein